MFAALLAAFTLAAPNPADGIIRVSLPSSDQPPIVRTTPRPGTSVPVPRPSVFVLGIIFQDRGGAQGIALKVVVPGTPADRAGFVVGMVIAEIDGKSTAGRSGEDCTRMVQEAGNIVAVKYYDPVTFKLRSRSVQKAWIVPPSD